MVASHLPLLDDPSGLLRLRSWGPDDVTALVEAWATPDIAGRARVGTDRSLAAATRWIEGSSARAATGLAVDLVIGGPEGAAVWGEVGVVRRRLRSADGAGERTVWEVGWWVVPAQRGRGLASSAVTCLGGWAGPALGIDGWIARIEPAHQASQRVATRVGLARRGPFDADHDLWAGPVPRGPDGSSSENREEDPV